MVAIERWYGSPPSLDARDASRMVPALLLLTLPILPLCLAPCLLGPRYQTAAGSKTDFTGAFWRRQTCAIHLSHTLRTGFGFNEHRRVRSYCARAFATMPRRCRLGAARALRLSSAGRSLRHHLFRTSTSPRLGATGARFSNICSGDKRLYVCALDRKRWRRRLAGMRHPP